MERVDAGGVVATAMTFARILSSTPACATGPSSVVNPFSLLHFSHLDFTLIPHFLWSVSTL